MKRALAFLVLFLGGGVLAEESASYKLKEHTFNSGGTPSQGTVLTSASFSITLASMGDTVAATGMSSSSFQLDTGFDAAYPPPGEVVGLRLTDEETFVWSSESSAGLYNLYRDDTRDGFGNCEEQNLTATTTTDTSTPAVGSVFYYLVTVQM